MNPIILLLCCFIGYTVSLPKFPQIGYLGLGYDIFHGNPRTNGVDYGFLLHPVLELTYYTGKETPDGQWLVPDNVTVLPTDSCTYDSSSSVISGSYSYQQTLLTDVKISSSVSIMAFSAAFSASTTFEKARSTYLSSTYRSVQTTATCETYRASFLGYNTSYVLSTEFIFAVETLPVQFTPATRDAFQLFYNTFGTHFVMSLTMGARMSLESVFKESVYQEMQKSSINVAVMASASFSIFSGSFSGSVSEKSQIQQNFDSKRSEVHQIYIGGIPFVDVQHGGLEKWGAGAIENPMPMGGGDFQITYLGDLLTDKYFPADTDIDAKRLALGAFYTQLCSTLPGCSNNLFNWPDTPREASSWPAIASDSTRIYFISGIIGGKAVPAVRTLQINTTAAWNTIAPIPVPVSSAAAIWVNKPLSGVFVFGGDSGPHGSAVSTIQFYDPTHGAWLTLPQKLPYTVTGIHCGILDNTIIIPGGFIFNNNIPTKVYSSVLAYSLDDGSLVTLLETLPVPVSNYAMVEYKGCLWVIGGMTLGTTATSSTQILCDVNGNWAKGPPLLQARIGAAASVVGDTIYVLGGAGSNYNPFFTTVEVFIPAFNMWASTTPLQSQQFGTDAILFHQNYLLLVGGGGDAGNQFLLYPLVHNMEGIVNSTYVKGE